MVTLIVTLMVGLLVVPGTLSIFTSPDPPVIHSEVIIGVIPAGLYADSGITIVIGRATNDSVTLNILANTDLDLNIERGTTSGVYTNQTILLNLSADVPEEFLLSGLLGDTRYYYRLNVTTSGGSVFDQGPEHSFHTQRASGSPFRFTIIADSHLGTLKHNDPALFALAMAGVAGDEPDLHFDLGDTFRVSKIGAITQAGIDQLMVNQRPFMDTVGTNTSIYYSTGNHECQGGWNLDGTDTSVGVMATNSRKEYYPNPYPDDFYSGDTLVQNFTGKNEDYFAFEWGDALFVVIDTYRYTVIPGSGWDCSNSKAALWNSTVGDDQYFWLKETLENSTAPFKFVFSHHLLGSTRGGARWTDYYEWGGVNDKNSQYEFDTERPTWSTPIHDLMVQNSVTIFFQGHDHLFATEIVDGLTYQTVPMPADPSYSYGGGDNSGQYPAPANVLAGSGYLRVTISDAGAQVEFVKAFLPGDENATQINGGVYDSYLISRQIHADPRAGAWNQTIPVGTDAGLDGGASSSAFGITDYWWNFTDGGAQALTGMTPNYSWDNFGNYTITLTVSDGNGSLDSTDFWIEVATDQPPVADAGTNLVVNMTTNASFDGSGSSDDFGLVNLTWTFDDGGAVEIYGTSPTYLFTTVGTHSVTLTVTDDAAQTDTDGMSVTVTDPQPVADAGNDRAILLGSVVLLDGSGSSDNDGVTNYSWTFTDGSAIQLWGESPIHQFLFGGNDLVTLTVADQYGQTDSDTLWVNVSLPDTPPDADAGTPQSSSRNTTITFDGNGSSDEGSITNWTWSFTDGGSVTLYGSSPQHHFMIAGDFEVTLKVTDDTANWDTATTWVNITDQSPVADAGADRQVAKSAYEVFDGSGASDDVGIVGYWWNFTDGAPVSLTARAPGYTWVNDGDFRVNLTVIDEAGQTAVDAVWFNVSTAPPIADAGADQEVFPGRTMYFDGTGSSDDLAVINYTWVFTDGGNVSLYGSQPAYSFANEGSYPIALTVRDGDGTTDTDPMTVLVVDKAPVPDAGGNQTEKVDVLLAFDGSGSSDDDAIVSWNWIIVETIEQIGNTPTISHAFSTVGNWSIRLTIVDTGGHSACATLTVTIIPDPLPVADAGEDLTILTGETAIFDGSGSSDDEGGFQLDWVLFDGTSVALNGTAPDHTFVTAGSYIVNLTVTDTAGQVATDQVLITVRDANLTLEDLTAGVPATGATYPVDLTSSAEVGLTAVNVSWEITTVSGAEGGSFVSNSTTQSFPIPLPSDAIELTYRVLAIDSHGNTVELPARTLAVTDILPPTIEPIFNEDPETGKPWQIGAIIADNIAIDRAWFGYRLSSEQGWTGWNNMSLDNHPSDPNLTVAIPRDTISIEQQYGVQDTAGLVHVIDPAIRAVLDIIPPVAFAGSDQTIEPGMSVTLTANLSYDNIDVVSAIWSLGGSEVSRAASITVSPAPGTNFTYHLEVFDAAGNSNNTDVRINVAMVAPATIEDSTIMVEKAPSDDGSLTLTGPVDLDDGTPIVNWTWSIAGYSDLSGRVVNVTLPSGTYTIGLRVDDGMGRSATRSIIAQVTIHDQGDPTDNATDTTTDGDDGGDAPTNTTAGSGSGHEDGIPWLLIIPIIAVGLLSIGLVAVFWYRRHKGGS